MRPRVAVNLTWLTPGRVGGSEEYLTRQLAGVDPTEFDLALYCDRRFPRAHPGLAARFRDVAMPVSNDRRALRIAVEHTWLAAKTRSADVVHHGGGTAPSAGRRPYVLTIHDLQYLEFPSYFSPGRRRYLRAVMPRSARRAAVIAVPSEAVRNHVLDAFPVVEDRVLVVPHGVPDLEHLPGGDAADVRARHGIGDRPYVVYPAITHPHKGHRVLIDAIDHLDRDTVVVLIGGEGAAEADLRRTITASAHADRVIRTGRVTDADRTALIADAVALVFPSEFEGFGVPVVEAMELDTPVVAAAAAALVEVVGEAGIIVGDATGEAWAAGVGEADRRRAELVGRGRRRRLDFTIDIAGRAISTAYELAAAS